jgi:hypothetical protein
MSCFIGEAAWDIDEGVGLIFSLFLFAIQRDIIVLSSWYFAFSFRNRHKLFCLPTITHPCHSTDSIRGPTPRIRWYSCLEDIDDSGDIFFCFQFLRPSVVKQSTFVDECVRARSFLCEEVRDLLAIGSISRIDESSTVLVVNLFF